MHRPMARKEMVALLATMMFAGRVSAATSAQLPKGTIAQTGPQWSNPVPDWANIKPACNTTTGSSCTWPVYQVSLSAQYSQNHPLWKDTYMEHLHETIGQFGCALTSTTMVLDYLGNELSPLRLNSALGKDADDLVWSSAAKVGGVRIIDNNGAPAWRLQDPNNVTSLTNMGLKNKLPVIIRAEKNTNSNDAHYMVVWKVDGDPSDVASYRVIDPYPNPAADVNLKSYLTDRNRHVAEFILFSN